MVDVVSGPDGAPRFPRLDIQLSTESGIWLQMRLVEVLVPVPPAAQNRATRHRFLREREHISGVGFSRFEEGVTITERGTLRQLDWLKGTVAELYGSDDLEAVALKDHVGQLAGVHPSAVTREGEVAALVDAVEAGADGRADVDAWCRALRGARMLDSD